MAEAEQRLRTDLEEIAKENGYENSEITVKSISSGGANYTSILFLGTVKSPGKDDINIFAKSANIGQIIRDTMPFNPFKMEHNFYTKLFKEYVELELKNNVADEYKIKIPKYYGSNITELEEALILENMFASGYETFNRFKPVDRNYAFEAVKHLARFHALSLAFAVEKPDEFDKFIKDNPQNPINMDDVAIAEMADGLTKSILSSVCEENRARLENFLPNISLDKYDELAKPVRRPVIIHADYRPSNLMHKVNEDGEYDIVVVDFQTLKLGCVINDLLYFIFSATDKEFRRNHYDDLIEFYYTELREHLKRLNIDPDEVYSREDFEFELKERLPFGLAVAVILLRVVFAAPENAPNLGEESADVGSLFNIKSSDVFVERLNGIIDDYIKWGVL